MKAISTIVLLFTMYSTRAQLPGFLWANELAGSNVVSVVTDAGANVYIYINNGTIAKFSSAGALLWSKQITTTSPADMDVDAAQNVYLIGTFSLTQDFDPGPAVFNMTGLGQNDVYLVKLDINGNFVWGRSHGGTQNDVARSLTISDGGLVLSAGYFNGTSDFDPGLALFSMTSGIQFDSYVSALTPDGDFLFAKQVPGGVNQAYAITTDGSNNIIVAGAFNGTKEFGGTPGAGTLTSNGASDIYVQKLDPAGGFLWARNVGGAGTDNANDVAVDAAGNIHLTGNFFSVADFDPGPGVFNLTSVGPVDIYVLKLSASGSLAWAKQFAGTQSELGHGIAVDNAGNVYTTGLFQDVTDFDPGPGVANRASVSPSNDIYISQLTSAGEYGWAVSFGGSTLDAGKSIAVDGLGNVYTGGFFEGNVDFDPGAGTSFLINSFTAIFLQKMATSSALPSTLLRFSAKALSDGVLLSWQTANETGTRHFEIEKSLDGIGFTKIGEQSTLGGNNNVNEYSFVDTQVGLHDCYYRLKTVDAGGTYVYSRVLKFTGSAITGRVVLFPNPVVDKLAISMTVPQKESIMLQLYNAAGKQVRLRKYEAVAGDNLLLWDVGSLPAGQYFITSSSNVIGTLNFIKR